MVNLMGVPIVQVLFSIMFFLDLEVVDQFLPLPFHKLYLAGSLGGSISLCIIMGLLPHDLFFAGSLLCLLYLLLVLSVPCICCQ
jgi:hypothetical protein